MPYIVLGPVLGLQTGLVLVLEGLVLGIECMVLGLVLEGKVLLLVNITGIESIAFFSIKNLQCVLCEIQFLKCLKFHNNDTTVRPRLKS